MALFIIGYTIYYLLAVTYGQSEVWNNQCVKKRCGVLNRLYCFLCCISQNLPAIYSSIYVYRKVTVKTIYTKSSTCTPVILRIVDEGAAG